MIAQGFWENPNLLEKKMLVISELGEAIEAHRKGRVCVMNGMSRENMERFHIEYPKAFKDDFLTFVKDTYEDELADVVLRIWDYMEYKGYNQIQPQPAKICENIGEALYHVTLSIVEANFNLALDLLYGLSPNMDWHIRMKMAYNKTRPHKHGKSY